MIKILVVEDEKPISNLICLSLRKAGFCCEAVFDGNEAADILMDKTYDLILLDVMLPGIDGFELMTFVKTLGIPVIFLTAKNSVEDKVRGLRSGAEDYIVKPFEIAELLARVDVVLRRFHKQDDEIRINGLSINTQARTVLYQDTVITLTPKEYELLVLFARTPNTALYRETIYEQVWGGEMAYGSKTVDLHVQRLRKKVGWENLLQAVNKVGYRLEVLS